MTNTKNLDEILGKIKIQRQINLKSEKSSKETTKIVDDNFSFSNIWKTTSTVAILNFQSIRIAILIFFTSSSRLISKLYN